MGLIIRARFVLVNQHGEYAVNRFGDPSPLIEDALVFDTIDNAIDAESNANRMNEFGLTYHVDEIRD